MNKACVIVAGHAFGCIPEVALACLSDIQVQLHAEQCFAVSKGDDRIAINSVISHAVPNCVPLCHQT